MLDFKGALKRISTINSDKYCLIIGGLGTNQARSPKIWNFFFKKNNLNCKMIPIEIKKNNLKKLFNYLSKDRKFIGGAVTKPYKEIIFKYLKKKTDIATKKIGSLNCIYKDKYLKGVNTDGLGFLKSLKKYKVQRNYKYVLLLGYGGAGKSVLVYLKKFFSKKTKIYCSNRTNKSKFVKKIGCKWVDWKNRHKILKNSDMVINCTSLGFSNKQHLSPINLNKSQNLKIVYDIIYNPKRTILLKRAEKLNINTINGLSMNSFQAFHAIKSVFRGKLNFKMFN